MNDLERKSIDTDSQLKALQKILSISQETESDLKRQLENAVGQKQASYVRLGELQKKMELMESRGREWMASKARMDRDLANARHQMTLVSDF